MKNEIILFQRSLGVATAGSDDLRDDPQRLINTRRRNRPARLPPWQTFGERSVEPKTGKIHVSFRFKVRVQCISNSADSLMMNR